MHKRGTARGRAIESAAHRRHALRSGLVLALLPAVWPADARAQGLVGTLAPETVARRMRHSAEGPYAAVMGGVVLCLDVPATEVEGQLHRHHQLLQSYGAPLGDGNDMFISVLAPDDRRSAPPGHRAVMISTHSALGKGSTVLLTQASGQDRGGAPQLRAAGLPSPRHGRAGAGDGYAPGLRALRSPVGLGCRRHLPVARYSEPARRPARERRQGPPPRRRVHLALARDRGLPPRKRPRRSRRAAQRLTMCAVLEGRMVYQLRWRAVIRKRSSETGLPQSA